MRMDRPRMRAPMPKPRDLIFSRAAVMNRLMLVVGLATVSIPQILPFKKLH